MKRLASAVVLCALAVSSMSSAEAGDAEDCQDKSLSVRQVTDACLRAIKKLKGGTPNDVPAGRTSIVGWFGGCNYGKRYQLQNGRTMECHTVNSRTGTALEVQILSDVRVIIDKEEYSVIIY